MDVWWMVLWGFRYTLGGLRGEGGEYLDFGVQGGFL